MIGEGADRLSLFGEPKCSHNFFQLDSLAIKKDRHRFGADAVYIVPTTVNENTCSRQEPFGRLDAFLTLMYMNLLSELALLVRNVFRFLATIARSKTSLAEENLFLRKQLAPFWSARNLLAVSRTKRPGSQWQHSLSCSIGGNPSSSSGPTRWCDGTEWDSDCSADAIPLLDGAALEAVKCWKYAPTIIGGKPVPIRMTVTVKFALA